MLTVLLIAISINFDSFSISVVEGGKTNSPTKADALKIGLVFGTGQALMMYIGSVVGIGFEHMISHMDHWIAFILLSYIGIKSIIQSFIKKEDIKISYSSDTLSLISLAIATSIDSLIIGITLLFINISVIHAVITVFIVTFFVSSFGFYIGNKLQFISPRKMGIIGGLCLFLLGTKILLDHLFLK